MKRPRGLPALLTVVLLTFSLFAGCGPAGSQNTPPPQTSPQGPAPAGSGETNERTCAAGPAARELTDMAGRRVTVPAADEIGLVFPTGPAAAIFLYMVAPGRLLGWNYGLNETERSILPEIYHDLPVFGMGDAVNDEAVIAAGPTIAVNCGKPGSAMVSDCDALSARLGIPVVAVDNTLTNSAQAFRFLGELLGAEEHAGMLAAYAEQTFADIAALEELPEEDQVRVYYGNGEDSLETAPRGSSHGQVLDLVKAYNVAELELDSGSRLRISAEQLLAWDPDVIVVNGEPQAELSGGSAAEAILHDPNYACLNAVREGKVYGIPNAPFNWVDRPPGPNRLIGLRWFSALLYPDRLSWDIEEEVREFFTLFYHVDLTAEQMERLLRGTL